MCNQQPFISRREEEEGKDLKLLGAPRASSTLTTASLAAGLDSAQLNNSNEIEALLSQHHSASSFGLTNTTRTRPQKKGERPESSSSRPSQANAAR